VGDRCNCCEERRGRCRSYSSMSSVGAVWYFQLNEMAGPVVGQAPPTVVFGLFCVLQMGSYSRTWTWEKETSFLVFVVLGGGGCCSVSCCGCFSREFVLLGASSPPLMPAFVVGCWRCFSSSEDKTRGSLLGSNFMAVQGCLYMCVCVCVCVCANVRGGKRQVLLSVER